METLCVFMSALLAVVLAVQALSYFSTSFKEGMANSQPSSQYTDPGLSKDPIYLAKVNASNITYLKQRIDELLGLNGKMQTLETQVDSNSKKITSMAAGIKAAAAQSQPSPKDQRALVNSGKMKGEDDEE